MLDFDDFIKNLFFFFFGLRKHLLLLFFFWNRRSAMRVIEIHQKSSAQSPYTVSDCYPAIAGTH